jgi:hypothetical protein
MKRYEAPEMIKIEFVTERVLDSSIITPDENGDPVVIGPAIDIFG